MRVVVTWKSSQQISPDDFAVYTKVMCCKEEETLKNLHDRLTHKFTDKEFHCELHFVIDDKNDN